MSKELIRLRDCVMSYGDEVVLDHINLYINDREFLTLLGPSGCGKTTTLRIIGGFLSPTAGDVLFDGVRINDVPPHQRAVNTVFQRYALFPHLNVFENVAFGLRIPKTDQSGRKVRIPEQEIHRRVMEMLEVVNLKGFEKRPVSALSGGQQQRVAIARALVNRPKVLLLDEPLGALDMRLRKDMQNELKRIQQEMEITFIYVTHDQEEAMAVSDRIAVMKDGVIQQCSRPRNIYHRPANLFVATFIGTSNILPGTVTKTAQGTTLELAGCRLPLGNLVDSLPTGDTPVQVSVRPEDFVLTQDGNAIGGTVISIVFLGTSTRYDIDLEDGTRIVIVQESKEQDAFQEGDHIRLTVKCDKINIYDREGAQNYTRGVVNDIE